MKVDLDARTLEAMRVLTSFPDYRIGPESMESIVALRIFLAAHDSARDAERDERLATLILNVVMDEMFVSYDRANGAYDVTLARIRKGLPRIREWIAKEQS